MTHTPGPWRWEVNLQSKVVQLCGGKSPFDLIVMDFVRYGMDGAQPRFNSEIKPNCNAMKRAVEFAVIQEGREHHASWFRLIDHPDARLIEAAPDMLAALEQFETWANHSNVICEPEDEEMLAVAKAAIAKARGAT